MTVTNVIGASTTSLTINFVIDAAAGLGPRSVRVTTAGGVSVPQDFTVTQNSTTIGDSVLIQGCAGVPLFPTDCTGAPTFVQQTVIVTADATDAFTFGVMTVNVQASSIIVTLQPGQGTGSLFNGTLVRGIDWVGMPAAFITGFTLTNNTMNLVPANVNVFENGHAVAINVGVASITAGSVTINLLRSP